MANQLSGQSGPSPRSYSQHLRYGSFAHVRYRLGKRDQFSAFLVAQAARLSTTVAALFPKLKTNSAARIKAAATFGSLS
jgi:hypothetical protein